MIERKSIDAQAAAGMVVLCAIWGFQQVAMKAAAPSMAPILQIAMRSGVSALVIASLVCIRREAWALNHSTWRPGILVGILFASEFLFVGEGLRFTSAAHMSIFLYTAPIFTALGLHLYLPDERLTALQWSGIGIAFAGIVTSFAGQGLGKGSGSSWVGDLLGILAGASYGATTLAVRFSRLSKAPATVTLLYQLAGAFLILLPASILLGQTKVSANLSLVLNLSFQIFIVSIASFLAWFALLRVYLASRLAVLSFMTPIFGVSFGIAILGERLDAAFIIGASLVLTGIIFVGARDALGKRQAS